MQVVCVQLCLLLLEVMQHVKPSTGQHNQETHTVPKNAPALQH
jgi:hypothetical protein